MNQKKKEVVFLAELDADIDDVIACEFLYRRNVLRCVVPDPYPQSVPGLKRLDDLKKMGVRIEDMIPDDARFIFVGGALTKVADYIKEHSVDWLVMNGGFVGDNIVKNPLKKFAGKSSIRTFNFNCDAYAADSALKSDNISHILLIGKNVCHSSKNTAESIWKREEDMLMKYHLRPGKRLHDLLACYEGLAWLKLIEDKSFLEYAHVKPVNEGLAGNMTKWGSVTEDESSSYRTVIAAIGWK